MVAIKQTFLKREKNSIYSLQNWTKKANETMSIKINGQEVKNVESTKFLGIHIDSNLIWKER